MENWTCETCIHYPPSSGDGKPCSVCNVDDPFMSCYCKKSDPSQDIVGKNLEEQGRLIIL